MAGYYTFWPDRPPRLRLTDSITGRSIAELSSPFVTLKYPMKRAVAKEHIDAVGKNGKLTNSCV
jgi:hypothetical protein